MEKLKKIIKEKIGDEKIVEWLFSYDLSFEKVEELEEKTDELATNFVFVNEKDLLSWYLEDIKRIDYLTDAIVSGTKTGYDALFQGNLIYFSEKIREALEEIKKYLI